MTREAIFKKLRLDSKIKMLIINAPMEYLQLLEGVTFDSIPQKKSSGAYDFVQVFAYTKEELRGILESFPHAGKFDCLFWVCYPKGTGGIRSDIKRDTVWNAVEKIGLRCVTQVAIDETWSALRARPFEMVGK